MTLRELLSQVRAYLAREYADKNMLGPGVLRDYDIIVAINHAYKLWLDSTYMLEDDDTKTFTDGIYNCAALNLQELIRVEIDNAAIGYVRFKDCADTLKIDNDIIEDPVELSIMATVAFSYTEDVEQTLSIHCTLECDNTTDTFLLNLLSSTTAVVGPGGSFLTLGLLSSVSCSVY